MKIKDIIKITNLVNKVVNSFGNYQMVSYKKSGYKVMEIFGNGDVISAIFWQAIYDEIGQYNQEYSDYDFLLYFTTSINPNTNKLSTCIKFELMTEEESKRIEERDKSCIEFAQYCKSEGRDYQSFKETTLSDYPELTSYELKRFWED